MEYERLWRNKWLTSDAKTIEEMADMLENAASELREMGLAGIKLRDDGSQGDDYAFLVTEDAALAERFGLEKPFWLDEEE